MSIDLTGQEVIVTGSTAGIGRATAERLARAGARVDEAPGAIREAVPGCKVSGVAADLATAEGGGRADRGDAGRRHSRQQRRHGLPARLPGHRRHRRQPDGDWLSLFQLNVMSGVRLSRHHLPRMVARGWGRVVFVSSESAVNVPKEMLDYGMTKTAQLAVSRGLAEAVAGSGVTVNAVLPGPTRSEILGTFMEQQVRTQGITQAEAEQGFLRAMRPTSLIKRFATTDEVANMVVDACSGQASATSGAALPVDGGVVRFVA